MMPKAGYGSYVRVRSNWLRCWTDVQFPNYLAVWLVATDQYDFVLIH
jgi:hypothetical protein